MSNYVTNCPIISIQLIALNSSLISSVTAQESYTSFFDWCQAQEKLDSETQHTIKAVLEEVDTDDCTRASKRLNVITRLNLTSRPISDVRPLGSLTNLVELDLSSNKIADIRALTSLTNLSKLNLNRNQIANVRPLGNLTNLSELFLHNNPSSNQVCPNNSDALCFL